MRNDLWQRIKSDQLPDVLSKTPHGIVRSPGGGEPNQPMEEGMSTMKRHLFAGSIVAILAAIVLSACGGAPAQTPAPETEAAQPETTEAVAEAAPCESATEGDLSVLEWSGYETTDFWADFCKAYPDKKVTFNFGASDPDIYAKVKAGTSEDIFHFYTPFLKYYVDEGLVQPLDTSKMKNWDKLPDKFKDVCTIDGKVYCIPWDWGFSSILYRTDKIPEGIDSWAAMFDEKYKGHISMWDDGPSAVSVATYVQGQDELTLTDDQLAAIKDMWIKQKPLNTFYWVDEPTLEQGFKSGDVWLAYAWNGAYYRLLTEGVPVAYANPKEGRNSWIGQYAISSKTDNYDDALAFLDEKLGEEASKHLLLDYAYGEPIPEYYSVVTDPLLIEALSLNDPTILDKTNFTKPISSEQRDLFTQLWAEVKAAP
jgi:spermidine/putrescine transport system substrate-binding protein